MGQCVRQGFGPVNADAATIEAVSASERRPQTTANTYQTSVNLLFPCFNVSASSQAFSTPMSLSFKLGCVRFSRIICEGVCNVLQNLYLVVGVSQRHEHKLTSRPSQIVGPKATGCKLGNTTLNQTHLRVRMALFSCSNTETILSTFLSPKHSPNLYPCESKQNVSVNTRTYSHLVTAFPGRLSLSAA
ncbi:hypothetical protein BASA81_006487 [Batrachochytrium salamandrivorans]|nr:hypothetical protein BASA81_006487 [Batrachochytrium salamandrivorans]